MLPYTLGELDKVLPKGKPPSRRLTGIGRNCDLFRSMVSEVFRPRWAAVLGAQGWSEAWLDHVRAQNVAMFAPEGLPDSECRSIAKSCHRYWTLQYSAGRFSDLQRARNGQRWHGDFNFDSFVERPVRDEPWRAKVVWSGGVHGMPAADLTALGAALRTSRIPCSTPSVAQGARWKLWSGALTRLRQQVPSRPPAEPCFPSPPGVHGPSA